MALVDLEELRAQGDDQARPAAENGQGAGMSEPEDLRIIRVRELAALLGVSTMTLWRWGQAGNFPAKVRLGANSVGYRRGEVERWLAKRAGVGAP
jgi:prophage regulatory protein